MDDTILITIVIISIYIFIKLHHNNVIYVEAYTGTKYLIHKDDLRKEKADLLATIVTNLYKLKDHMVKNKKTFKGFEKYIEQLDENFSESKTIIYETDPNSDLTSYSVNKGEELSFCLKSKKTGKLHDINLLMYVAIHEIAHVACPEVGHGLLFKKIFRKLTKEAINIGLYNKVEYSQNPVEYCGMTLSSSII